jgi:hypothetical protein
MQVRVAVALRVAVLGSLIVGLSANSQTEPSQRQQSKADCEALRSALAQAAVHAAADQARLCSLSTGDSLSCRQAAAATARAKADQQAEECRRQGQTAPGMSSATVRPDQATGTSVSPSTPERTRAESGYYLACKQGCMGVYLACSEPTGHHTCSDSRDRCVASCNRWRH